MKRIVSALLALCLFAGQVNAGWFPFPGPGRSSVGVAPIGAPTAIGSTFIATFPPASFNFLSSAAVSAGNFLICYVAWGTNGSPSVASISDGTNSYVTAASLKVTAAGSQSEIWYKANASAVGSGATITVTMTVAGSGAGTGTVAYCFQVANMAAASPFDVAASSTTNTTTPSVATGTLAQSNEIVFGGSYNNNSAAATYTESSGFTNLVTRTGTTAQSSGFGYRIVSATTSVTYQPTWNATGTVGIMTQAAAFKGL